MHKEANLDIILVSKFRVRKLGLGRKAHVIVFRGNVGYVKKKLNRKTRS